MTTELVPVVDLRVLSQSDLDALAVVSAHAVAPRSCPDADPLPPLKIDRAVFNESAGSRKQTFSRLRLAAAAASNSSSSAPSVLTTSPSSTAPAAVNEPENHLIAYHLRRLFARDDPSCPPSPPPPPKTLALPAPSPSQPRSPSPDPDRETTNSKGVSVDLVRLAGLGEPYDGELRRRTAGLMSESELMGFINGLGGKWVSQRRRRKYVDAAFFGDHLPSGWKLQLGLKRKEGSAWVHCFRYVSPRGHQFATCKEVSAYLMSLLGYPEARTDPIQYNSTRRHDLCNEDGDGDDDAVGIQHQIDSSVDNQNVLPVTSVTFSSHSSNSKDKLERNINPANTYQCQTCNLTLHDQSAYAQHQLLFHEKSAKRRRKISKFGEPIVGKDGKFECPVCHKTFEEQSRYFGHVGAHARYQGLTPEAFLDNISSGKAVNDSLGDLHFSLQELTESPEQNGKTAGEAGSQHQNYSKEHGGDSSKIKELFSTNCSDNFNRPNEAWCRPEEISPVEDTRSACKYRNDMMDCDDITVPKIAPQSNDQLDGSINDFAGVAGFNDQGGNYHVFRPTTFGSANHYEDQIIDRGLAASKHGMVNNTVKARDVNLNSCLDTICFPIASANNETSTALDEANQSSITGKCFSSSFNNNDGASTTSSCSGSNNKISGSFGVSNGSSNAGCISASYGNDNVGNIFGNKNNTMVYQSSLSTRPVSPVATNLDCFASRSTHSKNSDKERAYNTKERMDIMQNRASNEAGFGVEGYNNDVYTGDITERRLAQFNNNFSHLKPNISSRSSLPESNTLTASNLTKGIDVNCMKGSFVYRNDANNMKDSFVNRPISNNEPNGSVHDVIRKPSNDVQSRYNGSAPNCTPLAAANTSQNVNNLMSMQANFGSMSTLVRSVGDVPRSSTTQDQCDLQLGFGGQKQHIFPGYGELRSAASGSPQLGGMARNNNLPTGSSQFGSMVRPSSLPAGSSQFGSLASPNYVQTGPSQFGRMARPNSIPPAESSQFGSMTRPNFVPPAESSQFGSMARQNFVRTSEPTLVLGYAPQMGTGPPVQSGWDLNLSRMVSERGMISAVCVWCSSQFHHFGPVNGQQVGTYGFVCPSCKDKMSGQCNMPNNGSWQP